MTQNEVLRRFIKAHLAFRGLKQRPLAKKYGVSEAHFSEMLTGTRHFKEDVLSKQKGRTRDSSVLLFVLNS